jgi:endonuclease/exonuclease/phosphatase family metal-dependent hydrolase
VKSIRVVTLNLWNDAAGAERRMEVLLPQLCALDPQIVGLQEVREVPGRLEQARTIARALGADYRFAAADETSARGPIGNAVISRLPMRDHRVLRLPGPPGDFRIALRCELETPLGRLVFVTTHLSWELDAAATRERQIVEVDAFAKAGPGELPTLMTGDFNCTPDSEVHRYLTGRVALHGQSTYWRDAYQRRHPHSDGFTWSARNPYVARAVERDRRIDFVFAGPMRDGGPGAIMHSRVVLDLPDSNGVFPSDHFGVFAEIACVPVESGV